MNPRRYFTLKYWCRYFAVRPLEAIPVSMAELIRAAFLGHGQEPAWASTGPAIAAMGQAGTFATAGAGAACSIEANQPAATIAGTRPAASQASRGSRAGATGRGPANQFASRGTEGTSG
jgi:hypothetical protein